MNTNQILTAVTLTFLFELSVIAQVDVVELTAQQLAEGYEQNQFTVVDVTQAYLDRIDAFEVNYNAFTWLNENALVDAAALDSERSESGSRGPIHGVPVVIKESIDVAGVPSTMGFAQFSSSAGGIDIIPTQDATVVARLRDAGAVIIGKTNIPAFSLDGSRTSDNFTPSWDGHTYNSYDRSRAPGASSAGTATAVSANFAAFGLGEETSGSIQNPAGAQNLVGIKPTFGLVPNIGVVPIGASTRDVVGPMAKTVFDAALAMDVIAGPDAEDPTTQMAGGELPEDGYTNLLNTLALEGAKIGVYGPGWSRSRPSPETQALYESALATLVDQGAVLVEDPFADTEFRTLAKDFFNTGDGRGNESVVFDFENYLERIFPSEAGTSLDALEDVTGVDVFRDLSSPLRLFINTFDVARQSLNDPDAQPDLSEFHALQAAYLDIYDSVMDENDLDALVYPQMLSPIPPLSSGQIVSSTAGPLNIMGTPGITVPAGYYLVGMPFTLMFTGDLFSEAKLLSLAYDFEQATLHRVSPELLHVADINQDGTVDIADFLVLSNNFGKRRSGTHRGDLNADRTVDFADFLILSDSFGYGSNSPTSVPEPPAAWLSPIAAALLGAIRRSTSEKHA